MPDLVTFINELLDQKKVDSYILDASRRVATESALRELLLLARETDQLSKILRSSNQKEVEILCGELLHKVYLASKKDYLHKPGRRFVKALTIEATRRIQLSGNKKALAEEFAEKSAPTREPEENDWSFGLGKEEGYICPCDYAIKIPKEELGEKCPMCLESLPADLEKYFERGINPNGRKRPPASQKAADTEAKKSGVWNFGQSKEIYSVFNISTSNLGSPPPKSLEISHEREANIEPRKNPPASPKKSDNEETSRPKAQVAEEVKSKRQTLGPVPKILKCTVCGSKKSKVDPFNAGGLVCGRCGSRRLQFYQRPNTLWTRLTTRRRIQGITAIFTVAIAMSIGNRINDENEMNTLQKYWRSRPSDDFILISDKGRVWTQKPGRQAKKTDISMEVRRHIFTKIAYRRDGTGSYWCTPHGITDDKSYNCTKDGWAPDLKQNYFSALRRDIERLSSTVCRPDLIAQYKALNPRADSFGINLVEDMIEPYMNRRTRIFFINKLNKAESEAGITLDERNREAKRSIDREIAKVKACFEHASPGSHTKSSQSPQ